MSLKDQIQSDLVSAMKAKESIALNTLRLVKSAIMKYEVSGENMVADDDVVLGIIQKEVKQRNDSIEKFTEGGRADLAEKEEAEREVLTKYLPQQLTEDELRTIIADTAHEIGAASPADMGKLMGSVMPKVKGKSDGGMVKNLVQAQLNQ